MGMLMIKCPDTGKSIPTGLEADLSSFGRSPVFFGRTFCPFCHANHEWFAKDAWVREAPTGEYHVDLQRAAGTQGVAERKTAG